MTFRSHTLIKVSVGLVMMGALALFAYFGMYRQERTSHRKEMEAKLALDLVKENVTSVELVRGKSHTLIEKRGKDNNRLPAWHMLTPVDAPADSIAINSLLGVLERMDAERRIDVSKAGPLEKFGLAKPRLKWILHLQDGKKIELMVGKDSPFDGQLYAMLAGSKNILLLKGYLEKSLDKKSFDLREKHLLHIDPASVKGLVLQRAKGGSGASGRIELIRKEGRWKIQKPLEDRADEKEVQKIINVLDNLRARSFPKAKSGKTLYGLQPPELSVTIVMDDRRIEVHMGMGTVKSNKDKAFAMVSDPLGPVAQIGTYQLRLLEKGVQDLRFRNLMDMDTAKVARIKIEGEDGLLVLERSVGAGREDGKTEGKSPEYTWSLVSPVAKAAKTYKVQSLLAALAKLKATRLGPLPNEKSLKSKGLDLPQKTVTLFDEKGDLLGSLKIAPLGKDGTWVLGDARQNLCLAPSHNLSTILLSMGELAEDR